jgi:hypothetical protein
MARYDKYDPKDGGFRARLAEDFTEGNVETALGVSLDGDGHVVIGDGGNTDIVGVMVLTQTHPAGTVVDVMTDGEIVEFDGDPGSIYFAAGSGEVNTTDTGKRVGHTVEGDRLVVRCAR